MTDNGLFLLAGPGGVARAREGTARSCLPAGLCRALRQRGAAAARSLPGARRARMVRPGDPRRVWRHRRFGDRPGHPFGRDRQALRRAGGVAVPDAYLRRLRGVAARHARAKTGVAAQDRARRAFILLRAERAGIRLRCRRPDHPRQSDRWRLCDRRTEDFHLRHGYQRLLPAGDAHIDRRQEAARHYQFSGRYQAARHRGSQDRDAGPTRHRHYAGFLQRREGARLRPAGRGRPRLGRGRCLPMVRAALPFRRAHRRGLRGV